MRFILFVIIIMEIPGSKIFAQENKKLVFDGQASAVGSFSPENTLEWFAGGRYIPELEYRINLDTNRILDFEASANISGSVFFHPFDSSRSDGNLNPYRFWARYSGKQFEFRVGLQKIDFGSATLIRPLQWFNQIDPRDPLQLTYGVYGVLGRYYFLNNANIWVWGLYGNEKARGFDAIKTYKKHPEIGGRVQYPTKKGEMALSYHHRTASSSNMTAVQSYDQIPEDRIGLDAKWDVRIGLWFEASYVHKSRNIGLLTNQSWLNVGADYTFGIGNGINIVAEHLITSFDTKPFGAERVANITASVVSYPLGLFDNISGVLYYNWPTEDFTFFVNYQHQFNKITGYLMAYYNPEIQQGIQENELVNTFSGPGIRIMLVYNH
jgi:hypothetical protein